MSTAPSRKTARKAGKSPLPSGAASTTAGLTLPALNASNLGALTAADLSALRRVGNDTLVSVGGVTGVFTPVTGVEGSPLGTDERKNLLAIIEQLKQELAARQDLILSLQQQLAVLRDAPTSAPEDFATAIQQSLDELQQRMAGMHNGVSNFAVKEFKLDAGVFVQLNPLGSVSYRFVQPGEDIEAAAVSRLSLNVVPIPKSDARGVWTSNLFQPELPVIDLPEVGTVLAARLEKAGLYSIGEFMQVATRARAQAQLEAMLGVSRERLALWAQQAALMTLRGVNGAAANVLIQAGLGSFDALAASTGSQVLQTYEKARLALRRKPAAPVLNEALATQWVQAARQYLGLPDAGASA